jgi:hypothetical protein
LSLPAPVLAEDHDIQALEDSETFDEGQAVGAVGAETNLALAER